MWESWPDPWNRCSSLALASLWWLLVTASSWWGRSSFGAARSALAPLSVGVLCVVLLSLIWSRSVLNRMFGWTMLLLLSVGIPVILLLGLRKEGLL